MDCKRTIPADADRFNVLDFMPIERVPSKYIPNMKAISPKLMCPGCGELHELPGIDTTVVCKCGLSMQYDMASLHVWREQEKV